jgi:hypothetical protein
MELRDIEGRELPSGEVEVTRRDAFLWAEATRNEDDAFRYDEDARELGADGQIVPPVLLQHVANEGAAGTEEALADVDVDWESGVYLGEQTFEYDEPLAVGETYRVCGSIPSVEYKEGSSGNFHLVTLAYDIESTAGETVAETSKTIVFMEGGSA